MFFAINDSHFFPTTKERKCSYIRLKVIMKFLFRFAIFLLLSLVIATAMAKDAEAPRRKLEKAPKAPKAPKRAEGDN